MPTAHAALDIVRNGGVIYVLTVTSVALTAVFAPTPVRRTDARRVLAILLGRRRPGE